MIFRRRRHDAAVAALVLLLTFYWFVFRGVAGAPTDSVSADDHSDDLLTPRLT